MGSITYWIWQKKEAVNVQSKQETESRLRENEENLRNLREQYANVQYTHHWSSRGRGEKIYIFEEIITENFSKGQKKNLKSDGKVLYFYCGFKHVYIHQITSNYTI